MLTVKFPCQPSFVRQTKPLESVNISVRVSKFASVKMTVELIQTNLSHVLHMSGFLYSKRLTKNGRVFWNCKLCNATAVTRLQLTHGQAVDVIKGGENLDATHNHAPDYDAVEAIKLKYRVKRKAVEHPEAPPIQVLREELDGVPAAVLAHLPDRPNMAKLISRRRRQNMPTNPVDIEDLEEVPELYAKTHTGENFLLYDSREDDDDEENEGMGRILIFATIQNLRLLMRSPNWYLDGTFKVVPQIFFQLFTVLASLTQIRNGKQQIVAIPLVYALLENKKQVAYEKVLDVIRNACEEAGIPRRVPVIVMTDFELAILNAIRKIMTESTKVRACFFHLRQAVYRYIQQEGLQVAYSDKKDRTIKDAARMMCAIAFVPLADVLSVFAEFENQAPPAFKSVVDYFRTTYVKGQTARGRRRAVDARYPPDVWNMYDATLQNLSRTNNLSEGWHTRFALVVGKNHPGLYTLLKELKKEQSDTEGMIRDLNLGKRVRRDVSKAMEQNEERITNVVLQYEDRREEAMEYLKDVGCYIGF